MRQDEILNGLAAVWEAHCPTSASSATASPPNGAEVPPPTAPAGEATDQEPKARARVLLVEDNRVNQKLARAMLAKLGCEVDLAEDGLQALAMLAEQSFDVVLMD